MKELPGKPFLTENFSPKGGGIDFLGLRWVNLGIVGSYLLPEINNVTRDMGMFCLAGWIPWKFQELTANAPQCTEKNYRVFRQAVEVAISYQFRDGSTATKEFGAARNRVGVTQKLKLPGSLTFDKANRSESNSLYAPAIYGPAVRYLGMVKNYYRLNKDLISLNIPIPNDDKDATTICETVDATLRRSHSYSKLLRLNPEPATEDDLESLGRHGLHPVYYRLSGSTELKAAFRRRLLPDDPSNSGYPRTRTARLILATLEQQDNLTPFELRDTWYTDLFPGGKRTKWETTEVATQRRHWALFMARQYQRQALEALFVCFENALLAKCRALDAVVDYWLKNAGNDHGEWPKTFGDLLEGVTADAGIPKQSNDEGASHAWNRRIHPDHPHFEYDQTLEQSLSCLAACRLLGKWFWRMQSWARDVENRELMDLGGSDRLGMNWFLGWLADRRTFTMRAFLHDVFSTLVFAQHMRVALSRFDGRVQRLRFMLGDHGIEPTAGITDTGERGVPWMPDRLDAFVNLLVDVNVLDQDTDGKIRPGKSARRVQG
jgi:hypothetical protein